MVGKYSQAPAEPVVYVPKKVKEPSIIEDAGRDCLYDPSHTGCTFSQCLSVVCCHPADGDGFKFLLLILISLLTSLTLRTSVFFQSWAVRMSRTSSIRGIFFID